MTRSYPSGAAEHLHVQRVAKEITIDVGEGVAGGHAIQEWAGKEGGGVTDGSGETTGNRIGEEGKREG